MNYVCTKCGNTETKVADARPSLDDRYAVGYCSSCTRRADLGWAPDGTNTFYEPDRKSTPWPTVPLVRSDLWNPDLLKARQLHDEEDRILHIYADVKSKAKLSEAELEANAVRAREILAKREAEWQRT